MNAQTVPDKPSSATAPTADTTSSCTRALERLSFLYEAARTLSTTLDTDEILQQLMNLTHRYFRPDAVSVALIQADDSLVFQAASGKAAEQVLGMQLPPGTGIIGWVAKHQRPLWVPAVNQDTRFCQDVDRQTGFTTQAIYAEPVLQGERSVAVLEMLNPAEDMELQETQAVMSALAALAAPAIRNAVLFEQVSNAEERYQRLFELNLDPVIILNAAGGLLDFNEAAQRLCTLSFQEKAGDCLELLGLTAQTFEQFKATLETQQTVSWEITLTASDGQRHTLETYLARLPHYTPNGAYQWLAHDITDQVELEEMREQLSHMIVHDLRNPLGNIVNSIELISNARNEKDTTMPIDQLLLIALRSARRMDRLIGTILDTARMRSGEATLSVTTIDIPTLVQEVTETIEPSLKHRRQTFHQHIVECRPPLQGDVNLLRRALTNLLDNAIKFTPIKGNISLHITYDNEVFYFSVNDTGPGIAAEDQERIFALYVRGRDSQKTRGAGLGLAFCKLVVETHGGRIWVESQPGAGATFTFTIPRELSFDVLHSS